MRFILPCSEQLLRFRQSSARGLRASFFQDAKLPPLASSTAEETVRDTLKEVAKVQPYVLAQMNYARLLAPLDDPSMLEFKVALQPINEIAKSTPGFIWSYDNDNDEDRLAVDILRDDALLMPQLSLWSDMASLRHFVFKSGHAMYFKRKREWFTSPQSPYSVCWWYDPSKNDFLPPTLKDSFERCSFLKEHGPSAYAFDFATAKDFAMPVK
jgi:hypothetical protein